MSLCSTPLSAGGLRGNGHTGSSLLNVFNDVLGRFLSGVKITLLAGFRGRGIRELLCNALIVAYAILECRLTDGVIGCSLG